MATRIFIDGQEGTTGLQIHERLRSRSDLELLEIDPAERKNPEAKRALLREAQVAVLCLPDAAAVETARLAGPDTRLLDASTAHRVNPDWVYGLPELHPGARAEIRSAARVANPGCWPTGFLLLVRPLVDAGVLPPGYPVTVHGQSGYSGGGKPLINAFEGHPRSGDSPDWAARPYGLHLSHKHVPEMQRFAKLAAAPLFSPSVADYYRGMLVHVPLHTAHLTRRVTPNDVHALLSERYAGEGFVQVRPLADPSALSGGYLDATTLNGTNRIELFVYGHKDQLALIARLDNLGKGASGAAVQNLNLMLGRDEATGLDPA
ncbi:MAG: N-acetyl-gamma-glutamyl-phosphate reductase [Polyangiales bacterium]